MTLATELPIPAFFDPTQVGEVWRVPYQERAQQAQAWAEKQGIAPACQDARRICLLLVDVQNTFCIPGFELFVGGRSGQGAVDDNRRLCEFIYRHLGRLTQIAATLDTHTSNQVFHARFWVDEEGNLPPPMTSISYDEVKQGKWRVNPAVADTLSPISYDELQRYALHYTERLNLDSKYPLTIWPYHSMLGGIGHALVSAVEEACFFHDLARASQTRFEIKGGNPLTENYSVLRPEVLENSQGDAIAQKNTEFLETLLGFDAIIIAGQAKSHCVAWTISDLLDEITNRDGRTLAQKVYLLEDCTSPVVVPGVVDFTQAADEAFQRFAEAGMHRVSAMDPLETWPGFPSA